MSLDLEKQIPKYRIPMHENGTAHQVSRVVRTPSALIAEQRAVSHHRRHPLGIDQPGDGRYIPDFLGPAEMVLRVVAEDFVKVITSNGPVYEPTMTISEYPRSIPFPNIPPKVLM